MMDDTRIAQIRARLAARTQGMWSHVTSLPFFGFVASCGGSDEIDHHYVVPEGPHAFRANGASCDANFIAHAPSDLSDALSEIIRLRAENERLAGNAEDLREELRFYSEDFERIRRILGCSDETPVIHQAESLMRTLAASRSGAGTTLSEEPNERVGFARGRCAALHELDLEDHETPCKQCRDRADEVYGVAPSQPASLVDLPVSDRVWVKELGVRVVNALMNSPELRARRVVSAREVFAIPDDELTRIKMLGSRGVERIRAAERKNGIDIASLPDDALANLLATFAKGQATHAIVAAMQEAASRLRVDRLSSVAPRVVGYDPIRGQLQAIVDLYEQNITDREFLHSLSYRIPVAKDVLAARTADSSPETPDGNV